MKIYFAGEPGGNIRIRERERLLSLESVIGSSHIIILINY